MTRSIGPAVHRQLAPPSHDAPLPRGNINENPPEIGFWRLLAEDYRTHDRKLLEPGFVAVAVHRFGNARMSIRPRWFRGPFSLLYHLLFRLVNTTLGIDLPYTTRLGRRVRIWHHGGMVLGARAIGDDVHIRHNTTFGVLRRNNFTSKPIIGNRVEVGVGACILGRVTVGDDAVVGPNSVVLRDVPAGSVVLGVPARPTAFGVTPSQSRGS